MKMLPFVATAALVVNVIAPLAALLLGVAPLMVKELVVTAVEVPAYD